MSEFYVYCLFRPWNGEPCYIGKGKGIRARRHALMGEHHRNRHLASIFKRADGDLPLVILHEGLTEEAAFEYEIALIAAIGRKANGGPLCNLTDGGEGPAGLTFSDEARARISGKTRDAWSDPTYVERQSKGRRASWEGDLGRRERAAAQSRARWADPAYAQAQSEKRRARWADEGFREAMSAARKAKARQPEQVAKRRDAARAMWAAMSPEERDRHAARLRRQASEQWTDPARVEVLKAKFRAREANPEFKARRSEAGKAWWAALSDEERAAFAAK